MFGAWLLPNFKKVMSFFLFKLRFKGIFSINSNIDGKNWCESCNPFCEDIGLNATNSSNFSFLMHNNGHPTWKK